MKMWYGPQHACACGALVTPEHSNGFWRIPSHTVAVKFRGKIKQKPCPHIRKQVVAHYG